MFSNLNVPPKLCAVLHTFCLYLFGYSQSLLRLLLIDANLSASRRFCCVALRCVAFCVRYVLNIYLWLLGLPDAIIFSP